MLFVGKECGLCAGVPEPKRAKPFELSSEYGGGPCSAIKSGSVLVHPLSQHTHTLPFSRLHTPVSSWPTLTEMKITAECGKGNPLDNNSTTRYLADINVV